MGSGTGTEIRPPQPDDAITTATTILARIVDNIEATNLNWSPRSVLHSQDHRVTNGSAVSLAATSRVASDLRGTFSAAILVAPHGGHPGFSGN